MNILAALGLRRKRGAGQRALLPRVNAWVELRYGATATFTVCVEQVTDDAIVTSRPEAGRMRSGAPVAFAYTTPQGKFSFETRLLAEDAQERLRFAVPERITAVGGAGANQRTALRMDATIQGAWRMAAGGKGVGQFERATMRDISRGGVSIVLPCELRAGLDIEVQIPLGSSTVQTICQVMRVERIEQSSRYSHGVRFRSLSQSDERLVIDFINRRQVDLRARGLA